MTKPISIASAGLPPLPAVCLAISSFRHDESVMALIESGSALMPRLFSSIIIVDSLGTSAIPEWIERRGLQNVQYHSATSNLGSAGNFAMRLELAARTDAEFVYALNHDGRVVPEAIEPLVRAAAGQANIGAAYPLRRLKNQGGAYDITGTRKWPLRRVRTTRRPAEAVFDVFWGSSNGTLYSLAPVRRGLLPWSELWMGWEDLEYGCVLAREGYRQIVVSDSEFHDPYEFAAVGPNARLHISDKPAWYTYYQVRNLILIARRTRQSLPTYGLIAGRLALEFSLVLAFRAQKPRRWMLLARGVLDGLLGRTGMLSEP